MIRYYNMGEEKFRESNVWPLEGVSETKFYFQDDRGLSSKMPLNTESFDEYKVDFSVTTGTENRWMTQMGGPVMHLNNRNS